MQVPTARKLTTLPAIEQTVLALASIEKVMVAGDGELAVTVYVEPPTTAATGAVLVKVMVGVPLPTAIGSDVPVSEPSVMVTV